VALFERCDGFRKPARFAQMVAAAECALRASAGARFPQRELLERTLAAARAVNAGAIAQGAAGQPQQIPVLVRAARVQAVGHVLEANGAKDDDDQP
jgi:tRNA nucleotidyltransferase (CCA-adding enzyme)